jgi:hypothetical protein
MDKKPASLYFLSKIKLVKDAGRNIDSIKMEIPFFTKIRS